MADAKQQGEEEPTLEEQRELFTSMIAEAEHELRYAREQLANVEREIARRQLQQR